MPQVLGSAASLDEYVNDLTSSACAEFCADRSNIPVESVRARLVDYAGEVRVGASLLSPLMLQGRSVLEVGAGLGLLGVWLNRQGTSITLLEPGAGGFDHNRRLLDAVLEWLDACDTRILPIGAEALNPSEHGRFDVIYSVNVLEHIPHVERALSAMAGVLAPDGIMRHTCPNYAVPYEPHYGIPLVPFKPSLTAALMPSLAREEVWRSLSFITYRRVVRFCREHELQCRFDTGLLAKAFERFDHDEQFSMRQGAALRAGHRFLIATRLRSLLASVPPRWATPMAFSCWPGDSPKWTSRSW